MSKYTYTYYAGRGLPEIGVVPTVVVIYTYQPT